MKYEGTDYDLKPEDLNPDINTDVAIGGALDTQKQNALLNPPPSSVTDSSEAQGQINQAGTEIDEAAKFWGSGTPTTGISEEEARKQWRNGDATGWTKLPDGTWAAPGSLESTSDAGGRVTYGAAPTSGISAMEQEIINQQRKLNEEAYQAAVKQTQEQAERDIYLTREAQRQTTGAARSQLARMGALNVTSAGNQYMVDLGTKQQRELSSIQAQANAAIERARIAKTEGDLKILQQEMEAIDKAKTRAQQAQRDYFENLKTMQELAKYEKEEASSTVNDIVNAGYEMEDVPEGYFEALDKTHGLKTGSSALMFQAARKEKNRTDIKDAREAAAFDMDQMTSLTSILDSVPAGTPINIGESTYYGTKGTGGIEIDPQGNGTMVTVDQSDGSIKIRSLGFVGGQKGDWQVQFDGAGEPWRFSPSTGEMYYMGDASTDTSAAGIDMQGIIPDGTSFTSEGGFDGFNGQCGEYCRYVAGVRVGNSIEEKVAQAKQPQNATIGTPGNPVRIGDVVVQSTGGWTGHVAVVIGIKQKPDGTTTLILSEANMKPPGGGQVTSSRQISATDPTVQGFIRGSLRPQFQQGTDRKFTPKVDKEPVDKGVIIEGGDGIKYNVVNGVATPIRIAGGGSLTAPGSTEPDRVMGNEILRKQPDGSYKSVYTVPADSKEKLVTYEDKPYLQAEDGSLRPAPVTQPDGTQTFLTGSEKADPGTITEVSPGVKRIVFKDGRSIPLTDETGTPLDAIALGTKQQAARSNALAGIQAVKTLREAKGFSGVFGFSLTKIPYTDIGLGQNTVDAMADLQRLQAIITKDGIEVLRGLGAMSERELSVVQDAGSALKAGVSEAKAKQELARVEEVFKTVLVKGDFPEYRLEIEKRTEAGESSDSVRADLASRTGTSGTSGNQTVNLKDPKTGAVRSFTLNQADLQAALGQGYEKVN